MKIESEALGLHGEYESVIGVFDKGGSAHCCFGGYIGEGRVKGLVAGLASMLPTVSDCLGVSVPKLGAIMVILAGKALETETVRDDFSDKRMRAALEDLCDELGVGMPE